MRTNELALTPPAAGRLWLLMALFLVTLPHLIRLPLWLSALSLFIFIWRLLHELRGVDLPGRVLRYLLVALGIGAVVVGFRTLLGQEAGVALLTMMLSLKLLELRTLRDAIIALFIGYFMVVSGFLFSQSIFMGAYLFLVVLALTAALIVLNHPAATQANYRPYPALAGKMLLQSLPLMLLLFILFPRLSGPLWSMPEQASSARTGLSDSIEMGSISNLVDSQEVAFRVDFDGAIPHADALYWRGPVLWLTDGRRWERQKMAVLKQLPSFEPLGNEVSYTVTLEPTQRRWIFTLDLPLALPEGLSQQVFARPDFELLLGAEARTKLRYRAHSATRYRLDTLSRSMQTLATTLPDGVNPRTRALAWQWRNEGMDDAALVEHAYRMFAEQPFFYTRQPPLLGDDPVDEFLFSSRRGFCGHYASAFTTLMRAAGIPARVVTGYQGGELNELGNYLIVRQSNAHAWSEVWLEGKGWIRIDPTAAVPPERVESSSDITRFNSTTVSATQGPEYPALRKLYWQFRHGWDAVNHGWNQWVLGFDRDKQRQLLQMLGLKHLSWSGMIAVMAGLIGLIVAILIATNLLRRPRQRDPVLRLYHQFCFKLQKAGLIVQPHEGPADFRARVIAQRPELADPVNLISRLYIRLRYTPYGTKSDVTTLARQVRAFRI